MGHYNKIVLSGKVYKDPVVNEHGVCKLTLINEDGYGDKKQTYWFRCVAFNKTAEFIGKYIKDKQDVILDGKCCLRKYQDKWYTEVVVNNIQFNGFKDGEKKSEGQNIPTDSTQPDDDIPF